MTQTQCEREKPAGMIEERVIRSTKKHRKKNPVPTATKQGAAPTAAGVNVDTQQVYRYNYVHCFNINQVCF